MCTSSGPPRFTVGVARAACAVLCAAVTLLPRCVRLLSPHVNVPVSLRTATDASRTCRHMARDELAQITTDRWSDDMWSSADGGARLYFYFGRGVSGSSLPGLVCVGRLCERDGMLSMKAVTNEKPVKASEGHKGCKIVRGKTDREDAGSLGCGSHAGRADCCEGRACSRGGNRREARAEDDGR